MHFWRLVNVEIVLKKNFVSQAEQSYSWPHANLTERYVLRERLAGGEEERAIR